MYVAGQHLKAGDKLVTKSLDAVLKVRSLLGLPVGTALAGDRVGTGKGNVQDVLGVVAVVASQTLVGEAEVAHGDGSFTSGGETVGVTPDAVVLQKKHLSVCVVHLIRLLIRFGKLTSWPLQTTAMTLRGLMP